MPLPEISRLMDKNDTCCLVEDNRENIFDNVDPTNQLGYKCKICNRFWFFDEDVANNKFVRNGLLRTSTEFGDKWHEAVTKVIVSGGHLELNNVIRTIKGDDLVHSDKNDLWDKRMKEIWLKHTN